MMKAVGPFLVGLLLAPACLAHAYLESSTPAKGSTISRSPDHVTLVFSEPVGLVTLSLAVPAGQARRDLGPLPAASASELRVPLPRLAEGEYELSFVAQSSDLHEAKGKIRFRVRASAEQDPANNPAQDAGAHAHDHAH